MCARGGAGRAQGPAAPSPHGSAGPARPRPGGSVPAASRPERQPVFPHFGQSGAAAPAALGSGFPRQCKQASFAGPQAGLPVQTDARGIFTARLVFSLLKALGGGGWKPVISPIAFCLTYGGELRATVSKLCFSQSPASAGTGAERRRTAGGGGRWGGAAETAQSEAADARPAERARVPPAVPGGSLRPCSCADGAGKALGGPPVTWGGCRSVPQLSVGGRTKSRPGRPCGGRRVLVSLPLPLRFPMTVKPDHPRHGGPSARGNRTTSVRVSSRWETVASSTCLSQ